MKPWSAFSHPSQTQMGMRSAHSKLYETPFYRVFLQSQFFPGCWVVLISAHAVPVGGNRSWLVFGLGVATCFFLNLAVLLSVVITVEHLRNWDNQLFLEPSAHLLRHWQRPEDAFVSEEVDVEGNWWKVLLKEVVQAPSLKVFKLQLDKSLSPNPSDGPAVSRRSH